MAKSRGLAKRGFPEPVETLLAVLECGFRTASWHGSSLAGVLSRTSAAEACMRVRGRKTIWEQALHSGYWKHRVLCKVAGKRPFPRKGSNWPAMPADTSEAAWKADREMLREIHENLLDAVGRLSHRSIDPKLRRMIFGAAFHDVYHTGQIKLLRKLVSDGGG